MRCLGPALMLAVSTASSCACGGDASGPAEAGDADADVGRDAREGDAREVDDRAGEHADADADLPAEAEAEPGADADAGEDAGPRCGNGAVEGTEECDDGNATPDDGCESDCTFSCHVPADCDDLDGCTTDDCTEVPGGRRCANEPDAGTPCDDGLFCDGVDTCGAFGGCGHTGNPCAPDTEVCNESADRCDPPPGECVISGTSCAEGATDPSNECQWCRSAVSTTSWTPKPDFTRCTLVTSPDRSYDICSGGTCVSPGCGDPSCNAPGPNWIVPDTNQRTCYDDHWPLGSCPGVPGTPDCEATPYCGQDAQYGWDVSHAANERFERTETSEPVVTDNVTGLMWMGCVRGLTGSDCTGGAVGSYDWSTALAECDGLAWGGHSDWRLPDEFELLSIVDYADRWVPSIDEAAFPETPSDSTWSSSTSAADPVFPDAWAWYVEFRFGEVVTYAKTEPLVVRCVRGAASPGAAPRLTRWEPIDGYPVVADAVTGLVWQGCVAGRAGGSCAGEASMHTWWDALDYCQDSTWAGYTDWYLPDVKELRSIEDTRETWVGIDPAVFPGTPGDYYTWSSTTWPPASDDAYRVWSLSATVGGCGKSDALYVRCVRRGP